MAKWPSLMGTCLLIGTSALWAQNDPLLAPMAPPNAIPEGTTFLARLDDRLDTRQVRAGKRFKMKLGEDLIAADGRSIPRGKKIKAHVSSIEQGLHARMLISFDEIETDHGWVPLIATVTGVPGEHSVKTPDAEGEIERKGMSKEHEIEAVLVGAGIGAAAGSFAGAGEASCAASGAAQTSRVTSIPKRTRVFMVVSFRWNDRFNAGASGSSACPRMFRTAARP